MNDSVHITVLTGAEDECKFESTKDTPYLALTGELWGVVCDNLGENRPRYNGTAHNFPLSSNQWAKY